MRYLNILIPAKDRSILTMKTIESIHQNTKKFDDVTIEVYDDNSDLNDNGKNRIQMFYKLLEENKISYYCYNTNISNCECFGKSISFYRWIRKMIKMVSNKNSYFLLLDNDMILCPRWDEYFISVCDGIEAIEKNIHFLVKNPGGVPKRACESLETHHIRNLFADENIVVHAASKGGGSGFWFFNYNMLLKLSKHWTEKYIEETYRKHKGHDTLTWRNIRSGNRFIRYVAAVEAPKNSPLVLHMGGIVGSTCIALRNNTYDKLKETFIEKEREFEKISVDEIISKYGNDSRVINW